MATQGHMAISAWSPPWASWGALCGQAGNGGQGVVTERPSGCCPGDVPAPK